ncbi:unnamed protein product, partial [Porites lobata]
ATDVAYLSVYQLSIYNPTSSRLIAINKLQRFICDKKQNSVLDVILKWSNTMNFFLKALLCAFLVKAIAKSAVPTKSATDARKPQCNVNNYFYAGPNTKKIEQQLAEIREEIKALRENRTGGGGSSGKAIQYFLLSALIVCKRLITCVSVHGLTAALRFYDLNGLLADGQAKYAPMSAYRFNEGLVSVTLVVLFSVYKNCAEIYQFGIKINGVYKINPDGLGEFEVYCDQKTAGGGWTVFQKRQDGSVDFYRPWDDYKRGFGNLNGEFWLGLDKIHRLTVSGSYKLRVDLEDLHGSTAFAQYSSFAVTSERAKYQLSLGSYSGTAGDSLAYHRGYPFTTKDHDNDSSGSTNCAVTCKGAWWYNNCHYSNLNGLYLHGKVNDQGISWYHWKKNYYSVKRSEMKIRPRDF